MGIITKHIVAFIIMFLSINCVNAKELHEYINDEQKYAVFVPSGFSFSRIGEVEYDYFGYADNYVDGGMSIEFYNKSTLPCAPNNIGASKVVSANNSTVIWGEVDYSFTPHDYPRTDDGEEPFCRPPKILGPGLFDDQFDGSAAFALCGESNGKKVQICISQQTRNPEQAKQIFESFRWLDETETSSSTQSTEFSSSTITVPSVSSESSLSSSSSTPSEVAIEPTPVTLQPWYVRIWLWLLSWF